MTYVQTEEQKERNYREHTRQQLAQVLWRREGGGCASMLVSTLAQAAQCFQAMPGGARDLSDLCDQASELASPVPDYEEAAQEAGWSKNDEGTWVQVYDGATEHSEDEYDDVEELCRAERIDADDYQREVYEHWIVSDWLADKLVAQGEKCDKDFAGLTIWARTCTGQSIVLDGVMQSIALAIWPTEGDQKRVLG